MYSNNLILFINIIINIYTMFSSYINSNNFILSKKSPIINLQTQKKINSIEKFFENYPNIEFINVICSIAKMKIYILMIGADII